MDWSRPDKQGLQSPAVRSRSAALSEPRAGGRAGRAVPAWSPSAAPSPRRRRATRRTRRPRTRTVRAVRRCARRSRQRSRSQLVASSSWAGSPACVRYSPPASACSALARPAPDRDRYRRCPRDQISIHVPYLGAAPEDVEQAVVIRIEEAIQAIDGIRRIRSTASEGGARVVVEVELGAEARRVIDEVKNNVDAISTFPVETEIPIIREMIGRNQVVDVVVSGDTDIVVLKTPGRASAGRAGRVAGDQPDGHRRRAAAGNLDRGVGGGPPPSRSDFRRRGLRRAPLVARSSRRLGPYRGGRDSVAHHPAGLPGYGLRGAGALDTRRRQPPARRRRGDRRRWLRGDRSAGAVSTASPPSWSRSSGSAIRTPSTSAPLSTATSRTSETASPRDFPDRLARRGGSADRLSLMLGNGASGFLLVFVVLALFLELRLARWVSFGIPIAFLGAVAMMPALGASINVISIFAFVLVLGIVVDDAIVVGENVRRRQEGDGDDLRGAVEGAREIAKPRGVRCADDGGRVPAVAVRAGHRGEVVPRDAADRHPVPAGLRDRIARHPPGASGARHTVRSGQLLASVPGALRQRPAVVRAGVLPASARRGAALALRLRRPASCRC